jgi:hypothetical protein
VCNFPQCAGLELCPYDTSQEFFRILQVFNFSVLFRSGIFPCYTSLELFLIIQIWDCFLLIQVWNFRIIHVRIFPHDTGLELFPSYTGLEFIILYKSGFSAWYRPGIVSVLYRSGIFRIIQVRITGLELFPSYTGLELYYMEDSTSHIHNVHTQLNNIIRRRREQHADRNNKYKKKQHNITL